MSEDHKESALKTRTHSGNEYGFSKETAEKYSEKVHAVIEQHGQILVGPENFYWHVKGADDDFHDVLLQHLLQQEKELTDLTYSDDTYYTLEVYYKQYDMIERQLDQIFESKEGLFGSSDKARFILKHYIKELKRETRIDWDGYQIPKYGTKDLWIAFMDSYYAFINGKHGKVKNEAINVRAEKASLKAML